MLTYALNNDEKALIYLDYLKISKTRLFALISLDMPISEILTNLTNESVSKILGDKKALIGVDYLTQIDKIIKYLEKNEIQVTTIISKDYPNPLKEIKKGPIVLYYKGDISLCNDPYIIGVVGTRKPTRYGRWAAEHFVHTLVENGCITVSGLAYGIDSEAARRTLDIKGKTIAVLGGGLNKIYPSSNTGLAKEIINNGGLVISEYFPTFSPTKYTFPERNRIISGISKGVLVIEAGLKSGSLITADFAVEHNKELYIVPGNLDSKESMGSNKYIQDIPYAFVGSPEQILEDFGLVSTLKINSHQYSIEEKNIIDCVTGDPKTIDELCEILKEDPKKLNILLTEMEINGIIKKLPGNYYGI